MVPAWRFEIGDGQRNALAAVSVADDHEVARLRRLGDVGVLQFPEVGDRGKLLSFDDLEHLRLVGLPYRIPTVRTARSQRVSSREWVAGCGVGAEGGAEAVAGTVTEAVAVARAFWRPGPESGMGQAPEDREDGIEQGQCGCDGGLVHIAPGYGNGQMGGLPGGASRIRVVMESILARSPGSFSDVATARGAGALSCKARSLS